LASKLLQKKMLHLQPDFANLSADAAEGLTGRRGKSPCGMKKGTFRQSWSGQKKSKKVFDLFWRAVIKTTSERGNSKVDAMKKSVVGRVVAVVITVAALAFTPAYAGNDAQKALVKRAIDNAPVTELAAKAAALVSQAKEAERASVAVAAVEVIVAKYPAVATALVSAIAKAAPEVAAKAAAKAAELSPAQAAAIARAAALAAPKYAAAIAAEVARANPKKALEVAQAVMIAVPTAEREVANQVAAAVPQTQAVLKREARATGGGATFTWHPGTIRGLTVEPPTEAGPAIKAYFRP
jgi:hypothetical protein